MVDKLEKLVRILVILEIVVDKADENALALRIFGESLLESFL